MKQILRVALMVLLAAVLGVGSAWGEKKEYTDRNGVTWEYEEIETGATCSIWPKDRGSISGFVKIPGAVEVGGVSIKVVEIGGSAFWGCSGLTAVVIPGSVTEIGGSAFYYCDGLKEVTIPSSVTKIWNGAFEYCSRLTAVTIPSSVTEIVEQPFRGCSGLKSFEVESGNERYCSEQGVLFTKGKDTLVCYPGGKPEGTYSIPSSVTEIESWAFADCSGLTAVTIPSSVTEIESWAFFGCSGLKSFEVESGNKNYCAENGVLFTKDKATLVCYPGGKPEESYTIPSSVTEIGRFAFSDCRGLTGVTIPSSVTEIGWGAFSDCRGLTGVTIPSSVTEIGWEAFKGCRGLTAVTIPGNVTEIGREAFKGCTRLKAVYWLADANCIVDGDAFRTIDFLATLYVRLGMKAKIQNEAWCKGKFESIEEGYVVTFKDSDGHELWEQLVKPNGTATEPAAPTKKDDTFVEWQLGGKKYEFSTPVTSDITLKAKWKKADNHGTAVESVQLAAVRAVRNPVGEALELEGMERAARVEVYSVVGARVHAEALHGEPRVVIDAQGWASGVYVVRVAASDGAKTLRVVK